MFRIVLVHPDIPQNTGNIGRLCVGLNAELHLIHPLGFVLDDQKIRRSGLDYWQDLKLFEHASLADFLEKYKNDRKFLLTTKAQKLYTDVAYKENDFLILGAESKGLPTEFLNQFPEDCLKLPMPGKVRSMNVSNVGAVVAYEAYRQVSNR